MPLPPSLARVEVMPAVGRGAETAILRAAWDRAAAGAGAQLVLVAGDPGIGKTRLVADFARSVHAEERSCWPAAATRTPRPPYRPFGKRWVISCGSAQPADLRRHTQRVGTAAASSPRPASGSRSRRRPAGDPRGGARLFDATMAFLESAATDTPTAIVLDDLHWSDEPSLLLLKHLVRRRDQSAAPHRDLPRDRALAHASLARAGRPADRAQRRADRPRRPRRGCRR